MSTSPPRTNCLNCLLILALVATALTAGCEAPLEPYVPKDPRPPSVTHCNDYTGHTAGATPWVLGGTCCCTPSDQLMAALHADGICVGMSADDLRTRYEQAGIKLRGDGHTHCSGACPAGPHVVLGGKCMCPPTPGTEIYEKVIFAPPRVAANTSSSESTETTP